MIDLLVLQHHAGYASGSLIHAVAHSDNYRVNSMLWAVSETHTLSTITLL